MITLIIIACFHLAIALVCLQLSKSQKKYSPDSFEAMDVPNFIKWVCLIPVINLIVLTAMLCDRYEVWRAGIKRKRRLKAAANLLKNSGIRDKLTNDEGLLKQWDDVIEALDKGDVTD